MRYEVKNELVRRSEVIIKALESANYDEVPSVQMATGMTGSLIRFRMALAPVGYPMQPESWMTENETSIVMTQEEFDSDLYDELVNQLFIKCYDGYGLDSTNPKYQERWD